MNYKLVENILEKKTFEKLCETFNGSYLPWFYNDSSN